MAVRKKRQMTPEQREAAAERLRLAREKKGPAQYKNVAKSVLALPDDHYLSYKSVKKWIKTQQEIARAERRNILILCSCKVLCSSRLCKTDTTLYSIWRLV